MQRRLIRKSIKFLVCNKPLSLETDTGGEEHAFEYEAYGILPPSPPSPLKRKLFKLLFLNV